MGGAEDGEIRNVFERLVGKNGKEEAKKA